MKWDDQQSSGPLASPGAQPRPPEPHAPQGLSQSRHIVAFLPVLEHRYGILPYLMSHSAGRNGARNDTRPRPCS